MPIQGISHPPLKQAEEATEIAVYTSSEWNASRMIAALPSGKKYHKVIMGSDFGGNPGNPSGFLPDLIWIDHTKPIPDDWMGEIVARASIKRALICISGGHTDPRAVKNVQPLHGSVTNH